MERAVQLFGSEYDEIEEEANCLFEDLGIKKYPADCFEVARLLGIELVKYSDSSDEDRKFMTSKYEEGFSTMTRFRLAPSVLQSGMRLPIYSSGTCTRIRESRRPG